MGRENWKTDQTLLNTIFKGFPCQLVISVSQRTLIKPCDSYLSYKGLDKGVTVSQFSKLFIYSYIYMYLDHSLNLIIQGKYGREVVCGPSG